jgi:hypothetical protein
VINHEADRIIHHRGWRPTASPYLSEPELAAIAAEAYEQALRPQPLRLPQQSKPAPAIALLNRWREAVAAGDQDGADFAIASLKHLAQRPDRRNGA